MTDVDLIRAYRNTFTSGSGEEVLNSLKDGCFFSTSTFDSDEMKMAYNEGRRSVLLQILEILDISEEQLKEINESEADYDYQY